MTALEILAMPMVQEEIAKAMGLLQHGDKCILKSGNVDFYCEDCENRVYPEDRYESALLLPHALPLPGEDPSRTLVGMIEDFIVLQPQEWACETMGGQWIADTPYLALLLAFCAQHGIEVKK